MAETVLGLDVGPNSIGWAMIESKSIVGIGVRIFPEGVDNFDTKKERSRNEDRRISRGMRKQTKRRGQRKKIVRDALVSCGLFPVDRHEQVRLLQDCDPYELRARALIEKLSLYEIGRVLLHINQRRGFLSNRKKDREDKETRGMLSEISSLAEEMGERQLGEFLYDKVKAQDHKTADQEGRIRRRHTRREMLEGELEAIWKSQAKHHPELTDALLYGSQGKQSYPCKPRPKLQNESALESFGIHGLIFFQRKMYWPKSVVGLCELEPKQKRCPRADRHSQRIRLLQEVNNLRYIDPDTNSEEKLSDGQREMIIDYLSTREKATFDQFRKKLGFLESVRFTMENGKRPGLKGHTTDWLMAKAVGKTWHDLPESDKDSIVRQLLNNEREDDAIAARLVDEFGWTDDQVNAVLNVDFTPGYGHLSLVAIDRLLPHMERGLVYQSESDPEKSALHAAGYFRRDELQKRLFDKLPDPRRTSECPIGDIPNPVVRRALVELRKVVNAIIREYGTPDAIHVEMARSVRMGAKARGDYNARLRTRELERDAAANEIRARKIRVSREAINRYLFWKEQGGDCIYCGKTISQQQLFGGEIDVDHILPYSRCLDDSQANKVVCHQACNHAKGQRTPFEWLADTNPTEYDRVCQHVGSLLRKGQLQYGKYRKFLQKDLDLDKFIARQLTDTGYIARTTAEYLRCLSTSDNQQQAVDVLGVKGQHTAELRWQWGLNNLLRTDGIDQKSRDDHRHHAVDALIVALTNRSRLQQLTEIRKSGLFDQKTGEVYQLPFPWKEFRKDAERMVNSINVSYRAERKVSGALHEETLYGPTSDPNLFVVRKPLENLSPNEVPLIRDEAIRKIIEKRFIDAGIEIGRGKKVDSRKWKQALCSEESPVTMKSDDPNKPGVPIKKVRVFRKEQTIQPIRRGSNQAFVKPGSTHHLCIFEWEARGKVKRDAVFVTTLEAINRVKKHEAIIQRVPPPNHPVVPEDARFVMSLSRGELVQAERDGEQSLLVLKTAISTNRRLIFAHHTDARKSSEVEKIAYSPRDFGELRKVTVDPLGRIRWAND